MNRHESVNELKAVWSVLNGDLDLAVEYGRTANTPYAQRALIRAFFAAVEGLSYQLRQVTLASLSATDLLTRAERSLLAEERHFLNDKGLPKTVEAFMQFPQSLLFSIATYIKNHGASFSPDLSGPGWQAFRRAVELRNRVTHPKSFASLAPSDSDLEDLMAASRWWHTTMLEMFKACDKADESWKAENVDRPI